MNSFYPQLPEYNPRPDLWARIEADLNADQQLDNRLKDLPVYQPNSDLWLAIEHELDSAPPISSKPLHVQGNRQLVWAGLAAAMLVLVGGWLFFRPNSSELIRLEYAVEQPVGIASAKTVAPLQKPLSHKAAEAFIARRCAEEKLICQRPEVHELRNQLVDLTNEWKRIERERQVFGDDPMLMRAQAKVENQRTEITKELITLLRS